MVSINMSKKRPVRLAVPSSMASSCLALLLLVAALLADLPIREAGDGREVPHNCRFWGLVGSEYPQSLISEHLSTGAGVTLKELGRYNDDGWGLGYYLSDTDQLNLIQPLERRGGPAASHEYDPDFDLAIDEFTKILPQGLVGSVRLISNLQHNGVPSPAPFLHEGYSFAHSGSVYNITALRQRFLDGDYLDQYPPEYEGSYIDSELLFLSLLRLKRESDATGSQALLDAIRQIAETTGHDRLDFTMTDGDTLYTLRYQGEGEEHPVLYGSYSSLSGGKDTQPDAWVVATEPMGEVITNWQPIPLRTLAVFVPNQAPLFYPIGDDLVAPDALTLPLRFPRMAHFWSIVGAEYGPDLLIDQLRDGMPINLKQLGVESTDEYNTTGWGFTAYAESVSSADLSGPICRRGQPPASHSSDPDFELAVSEVSAITPKAVIGHVRLGTSGHWNLPNPHPFKHEGYLFGHNGTVSSHGVRELILADDPNYLEHHPPDYVDGNIDSELYLLYILKYIREHPALTRPMAIRSALAELIDSIGSSSLNFVMTAGDTLYALRYGQSLAFHPSDYGDDIPTYWVAASQAVGSESNWASLPNETLTVLVPGQRPQYLPIDGHTEPLFSISRVQVTSKTDADNDGWVSEFTVKCNPDVEWGEAAVCLRLLKREAGDWEELGWSEIVTIEDAAYDEISLPRVTVTPPTLVPTLWDLSVELYRNGPEGDLVASVTPELNPDLDLNDLKVEGADYDSTSIGPPEFELSDITLANLVDHDGDEYSSAFDIGYQLGLGGDSAIARAFLEVVIMQGSSISTLIRSPKITVTQPSLYSGTLTVPVVPLDQSADQWDLVLALYNAANDSLHFTITKNDVPALGNVAVEGAEFDQLLNVGHPYPNPVYTLEPVHFPLTIPEEGHLISFAIWDLAGRLVYQSDPEICDPGLCDLVWDGRLKTGKIAPSGLYFCRLTDGKNSWKRRLVISR